MSKSIRRIVLIAAVALTCGCATFDPLEDTRIESEVKARLVGEKTANLTRLGCPTEKHPTKRRSERLQTGERILAFLPPPGTVIEQPHRLQHPLASSPRIGLIVGVLQTRHQRVHHAGLSAQRQEPTPQRPRDPDLSRTPVRPHKR